MTGGQASNFLLRTRGARKVIVVDLGFLGDSVHLVPALWEVRRHYPGAEVHTLSAMVGAEVLKLAPCLTRAWGFPLSAESPPWWRHWDIIGALRRERFDVAYNFSGADRTIFMTALTGAPHRLAHEGGRKHFWNRWFIGDWIGRQDRSLPVYEQRRQVLAACGFALEPARFDLKAPDDARRWASGVIPPKTAHLSINASGPEKEWPLANWVELVKRLLEARPEMSLAASASGNPRERERLAALRAAVTNNRLICVEAPSIGQLSAALERCRLHIGADSGVLHLAMALGTPTLGVFRQYDGLNEWLPRGEQHRALVGKDLESVLIEAMTTEALRILD